MTDFVEAFAASHPDAVIKRGDTLFVTYEVADRFIEEAAQHGCTVTGLEGFLVDDETVYPSSDRVASNNLDLGKREAARFFRSVLRDHWATQPVPDDLMHPSATGRHMIVVSFHTDT